MPIHSWLKSLLVQPQPVGTINYTVTITMDSGPIYTFNPDVGGAHQTVTRQDNFISDFAGFTQGSVMVQRDDTPTIAGSLRVIFRKDVSPNPNRIEIILEAGYPVQGQGNASNIGPFTLQIFHLGVAQQIPYATVANPNNTTTSAHFPQMGWMSRWRWNPTPRVEVRSRASLLPSGLNLLPNYSQTMATTLRSRSVGSPSGPVATLRYSSAFATGFGNDINPVGVNEGCGIATRTGGVGDRPELGTTTDWCADYVITGNMAAQTAMYVLAEVAGGEPYAIRDPATWSPIDLVSTATHFWNSNDPNDIATPVVFVPSGNTDLWELETNHLPALSYVPYMLTGDPYYLENLQFQANWYCGDHTFHRFFGWKLVEDDPASPVAANPAGAIPLFPNMRFSTRGLGWCLRDWGMALLATPASVPAWLKPRSYFQSALDQNLAYIMNNSGCPGGTGSNHDYVIANYPQYVLWGSCPGARVYEQGFFVSYLLLGLGFLVNQAFQTTWQAYFEYACKSPIGLANGTSGWPYNWPSPYFWNLGPVSTDYQSDPTLFTTFAGMWAFYNQNQGASLFAWANDDSVVRPNFPQWQALTGYKCNSWAINVRAGQPILPNAGDVVSITIAGAFSGSPATVTHTVTSGDVTAIAALQWQDHSIGSGYSNPIVTDLITKINASAAGLGGILAATSITGITDGYWFNFRSINQIYLNFNSLVVGNITVTGSYTSAGPNAASSLWITPNGDAVRNGVASANLFGRNLSYQAATTGTSGNSGGPTGHVLGTPTALDGNMRWYFTPEWRTDPFTTPSSITTPTTRMLQVWTNAPDGGAPQFGYPAQAWTGMNVAVSAGVPGAATAATNLQAIVLDWLSIDSSANMRFAMAIDHDGGFVSP